MAQIPPRVVSVTGHRDLTEANRLRVWAAMKGLIMNPKVDEIWFGGAKGADNEALKAALHHRGSALVPRLVVVVPDTVSQQPWECQVIIQRADQRIELGLPITADDRYAAYHRRNEFLVDHASLLVAFWDGKKSSGTSSTVNYAKKTNCLFKHIPMV